MVVSFLHKCTSAHTLQHIDEKQNHYNIMIGLFVAYTFEFTYQKFTIIRTVPMRLSLIVTAAMVVMADTVVDMAADTEVDTVHLVFL